MVQHQSLAIGEHAGYAHQRRCAPGVDELQARQVQVHVPGPCQHPLQRLLPHSMAAQIDFPGYPQADLTVAVVDHL